MSRKGGSRVSADESAGEAHAEVNARGAAQAREKLAQTLRRIEPTAKYSRQINQALIGAMRKPCANV